MAGVFGIKESNWMPFIEINTSKTVPMLKKNGNILSDRNYLTLLKPKKHL